MGGSGAKLGRTVVTGGSSVSPSSTGGRLVQQNSDQWYGETDSGYSAVVLDGGRDDINMYRYGSRQIYEVMRHDSTGQKVGDTLYIPTKAEALATAKEWLNEHK